MLREHEIDIAVDLKGFTRTPARRSSRTAPRRCRSSYLGYPGTMGADFIDYVIADRVVIAVRARAVTTPRRWSTCRTATRSTTAGARSPTARRPARDAGSAGDGLRLLLLQQQLQDHAGRCSTSGCGCCAKVPGSVLWLMASNRRRTTQSAPRGGGARRRSGSARLRAACAAGAPRPSSPGRPVPRHAALQRPHHRQRRAVGRTAGADLPGRRVRRPRRREPAHAVGLPELVTHDLAGLRGAGAAARRRSGDAAGDPRHGSREPPDLPLFDTDRFRRGIEAAYLRMWERAARRGGAGVSRRWDPRRNEARCAFPCRRRCDYRRITRRTARNQGHRPCPQVARWCVDEVFKVDPAKAAQA